MARKVPYLLFSDGRYYARKVVPSELRVFICKNELREPLGADRRNALEILPSALVKINAQLDHGRLQMMSKLGAEAALNAARAAPMTASELAREHYNHELALDQQFRNAGPSWAAIDIDDGYVSDLRKGAAGALTDAQYQELLGGFLRRYYLRGNIEAELGTQEWRLIARSLADAQLEVLGKVQERDEGKDTQNTSHPPYLAPKVMAVKDKPFLEPVSLQGLLQKHLQRLESNGRGVSARKRWTPVFEDLRQFLVTARSLRGNSFKQADDARCLTALELIAWRDSKLETLSPKTVRDVWLASLKAVLSDAVADRILPENVAKDVKVKVYAKVILRAKGFTDDEALAVLRKCADYQPTLRDNPANNESAHVTAAKRWGPWLCAFTGARVTEILQLRKADILEANGINYVRISPDAGSVKSHAYRDVPIHLQLIDIGFLKFVEEMPDGPLFHVKPYEPGKFPAQAVATRVGKWLHEEHLIPKGIQPNHGWRHRFKTLSIDAGMNPRVIDSIQGHSGRTASDGYRDVTLRAKKAAIDKLDRYPI